MSQSLITAETIEHTIILIRGQKVIIDADLAKLYGVSTKRLNEQIRRNIEKFPEDFMLQLTDNEKSELVANCDRFKNLKHSSSLPYAFTEHGVIMAANILNSLRATDVSIYIVRAFVKLRQLTLNYSDLTKKIDELEKNITTHDQAIRSLFTAIREIMTLPRNEKQKIGFKTKP